VTIPVDYTATLPGKRMAAAVLFTDADGRALLVEPSYKDYWELPGGAVERDESPRDAAVREVKEELDLSVQVGALLVVDWVPPRPGRTEGLCLVFDGGEFDPDQTAAITLQTEELRSWAWCDRFQLDGRMSPLLAHRTARALEARAVGAAVYLHNGQVV
jgi:8-oxo-dGTP pyrophosphatase MutT (NUDIX family)